MGTVGDALDNVVAESFFATLQTDLLDCRSWATRTDLAAAILSTSNASTTRSDATRPLTCSVPSSSNAATPKTNGMMAPPHRHCPENPGNSTAPTATVMGAA